MKHTYHILPAIFLGLFLITGINLKAQSFQLENVAYTTFGSVDDDLETHAYVRNISDQTRRIYVRSDIVDATSGHQTFFCWEECYYPGITVSPTYIEVGPNEVVEAFKGYLRPNGITGVSAVRFSFYSSTDIADSVSFIAVFDASPASLGKITSEPVLNAYPNPADYKINIAYENLNWDNRLIEVYNMLGIKVGQIVPESNTGLVSFNTSNLKPGVYFYVAHSGGKTTKPGRFTVKR